MTGENSMPPARWLADTRVLWVGAVARVTDRGGESVVTSIVGNDAPVDVLTGTQWH